MPVDVSNPNPDAAIASPLRVYASKVGSFANVNPDKPRSILTLAPFANVPTEPEAVVQVTLVSIYGKNTPRLVVSEGPVSSYLKSTPLSNG